MRPFHGLQFTTFKTESIPAVALTVVDDIVPLSSVRKHTSWGPGTSEQVRLSRGGCYSVVERESWRCRARGGGRWTCQTIASAITRSLRVSCSRARPCSRQVFTLASRGVDVKLSTRVRAVAYKPDGEQPPLIVRDQLDGEARFDRVVFACHATAAASALSSSAMPYELALLRGVAYHDDVRRPDWRDWLEASVHQVITRAVTMLQELLLSRYSHVRSGARVASLSFERRRLPGHRCASVGAPRASLAPRGVCGLDGRARWKGRRDEQRGPPRARRVEPWRRRGRRR